MLLAGDVESISANGSTAGVDQLDRIDDRSGLDGTYRYCWAGYGVTVFVVDTGIWADHDEFRSYNECTGTFGPTRVTSGWDFNEDPGSIPVLGYPNDPCPGMRTNSDPNTYLNASHGTAVASLVGGLGLGSAPGVSLVPVRVFDCNQFAYISTVVRGLDWVNAQTARPAVVNLSFTLDTSHEGPGGDDTLSALDIAVGNLLNSGFTVVAAAGNSSSNVAQYSPARVQGAITVGASSSSDQVWSGSNLGVGVDIFAVGVEVLAAHFSGPNDRRTNLTSGTSFSTALVSGAAARWLQGNPGFDGAAIQTKITEEADQTTGTGATLGALTGDLCIAGSCAPNKLLYKHLERCRVVCGP